MASSTSCVIMNTVCLVWAQMRSSSSWMVPRVSASSAPKGSSSSSMRGSIAKARAMPTRCFMPPESCDGFLSSAAPRPTSCTYFSTWEATWARGHCGHLLRTAKAMLSRTLSQGISA